jgi:NitT/TauT family transport system substrate-binding protein
MALLVRKDLIDSGSFKTIADLKGKRVTTISPASVLNVFLSDLLTNGGLKMSDVNVVYLNTFADALAAFGNKGLDAAVVVEPVIQTAVDQGLAVRWRGWAEESGNFQGTVIIYSDAVSEDVGKRFMVGYLRGLRDYIDAFNQGKDQDAVIKILTSNTILTDPAPYKKMAVPDYDPNGQLNVASLQKMLQWFVENNQVKTAFPVQDVVNDQYREHALGILGRR